MLLAGQGRESEEDSCRGKDGLTVERDEIISGAGVKAAGGSDGKRFSEYYFQMSQLKYMKGRGNTIPIKSKFCP